MTVLASTERKPKRIGLIPTSGALGAQVTGVDLSQPLDDETFAEIEQALGEGVVNLHSKINARYHTVDENNEPITVRVATTPGRMLLSELLPRHPRIPFSTINKLLTKKDVSNVIDVVYRHCGQKETVIFAFIYSV